MADSSAYEPESASHQDGGDGAGTDTTAAPSSATTTESAHTTHQQQHDQIVVEGDVPLFSGFVNMGNSISNWGKEVLPPSATVAAHAVPGAIASFASAFVNYFDGTRVAEVLTPPATASPATSTTTTTTTTATTATSTSAPPPLPPRTATHHEMVNLQQNVEALRVEFKEVTSSMRAEIAELRAEVQLLQSTLKQFNVTTI